MTGTAGTSRTRRSLIACAMTLCGLALALAAPSLAHAEQEQAPVVLDYYDELKNGDEVQIGKFKLVFFAGTRPVVRHLGHVLEDGAEVRVGLGRFDQAGNTTGSTAITNVRIDKSNNGAGILAHNGARGSATLTNVTITKDGATIHTATTASGSFAKLPPEQVTPFIDARFNIKGSAEYPRWLRAFARRQPGCRALIANHDGIGMLIAPTILAELGDARRVANGDAATDQAIEDRAPDPARCAARRGDGTDRRLAHFGPHEVRAVSVPLDDQ